MKRTLPVLAVLVLSFNPTSGIAQITTGALTGRIADASGAAVPNASVELTEVETQGVRKTTTGATGEYTFALLPPGTYNLRVELSGFQSVLRSDIQIRVNEVVRADVALQLGAVQQTVEVTGAPPALQTESAEIGGVVEHQTITELPLNGRNFIQLIALQPGGVSTAKIPGGGISYFTSTFGGNYSVYGAGQESTNYLLDGIDMRDVVDTRVGFEMTVDAIQEFKFEALNYSAAFGRAAGGQINIASRSGSNRLHGSAWEFLRNDLTDARNFFAPTKPKYRQNQFGATAGGPVVKDKLFFFLSYEGLRVRQGLSRANTVPTLKERAGDFSDDAPIFNPLSIDSATGLRQPFPGNQISSQLMSPVAVKALNQLFPVPNQPGTKNNLLASASQAIDNDQGNVRLDYQPRTADRFFGRYTRVRVDRDLPFSVSTLPDFLELWLSPDQNAVIGWTHVINARTVNEAKFGLNRHSQVLEDSQQTVPINQQLGITGLTTDPRFQGNPSITVTGYAVTGVRSNDPNNRADNAFVWLDNLSHVAGAHNLSSGFSIERSQSNGGANPGAHGQFTFNGAFTSQLTATGTQPGTGNAVADFLLGFPVSSGRCCLQGDGFRNFRKSDFGVYFQDDWKVRPRLTLNLGLRWEHFQPPLETTNRLSQPDLSAAPALVVLIAGKNGIPRGIYNSTWKDFSPRLGFAYSLGSARKTVVRGGYGIFYDALTMLHQFGMDVNPPFTDRDTFLSSSRTPQLTLANAFPANLGIPTLTFWAIDRNFHDPYKEDWNLTVQRDIGWGTVVSAAYVGNRGVRLATLVVTNLPPSPGLGSVASRRPVPSIANVTLQDNEGKSVYHGLELKAEKHFSQGLGFLSSLVWSKCIDTTGDTTNDGQTQAIRNPFDASLNRGLCRTQEGRRFVTNFMYELPFAKQATGPMKWLAANWQVASIITLEDGQPFSVLLATDNSNTGRFLDTPDLVPGQDPNHGPRTPTQWFNVNAFKAPVPLTYGGAGRDIVFGPGLFNVDFSAHKNFRIKENQSLEFRTEFFNIFNRANFLQPGRTFGTPTFGVISGAFDPRDIQFSLKYMF